MLPRSRLKALLAGMLLLAGTSVGAEPPDPELRSALIREIDGTSADKDRYDAEVWTVDMANRLEPYMDDEYERLKLLRTVYREATRTDLPPELVLAVIEVESRFDRYAISRSGALGLMQIMPFWLDEIGNLDAYRKLVAEGRLGQNLFQLETNIWFGCSILKHYLDMEQGNTARALARYNGSLGKAQYPRLVSTALHRHWHPQ